MAKLPEMTIGVKFTRCDECNRTEVVFCKDCVWFEENGLYCKFWHGCRHPEHFCGEGERKTE